MMNDMNFMMEALKEAKAAEARGECPVGAVLVRENRIVARAGNEELALCDPTAHAEILTLRRAGTALKRHTFSDCTIYTTLWPCPMCEKAMLQAQVARVVSGARSFRWISEVRFNLKNIRWEGPVMEEACRDIFIEWVRKKRPEILQWEAESH